MSEPQQALQPGTFCWFELATTDGPAAKQFYTSLFGWNTLDQPIGPDQVYTMLKLNGKDVGALFQATNELQGAPPHWLTYISVTNADQSAAKAAELGGTVLKEAFDVMEAGRMALIQDPQGAVFALWQAGAHTGSPATGEPNSFCWAELATTNPLGAIDFYKGLFGWTTKPMDLEANPYTEIFNNGVPIAGAMALTEQMTGVPPHWMIYFAVSDCDKLTENAVSLGGMTCVAPTDIPNVGRFSVIKDPQGAAFAVIKLGHSN